MPSLKEIRNKISSVKSTKRIMQAMKMIATVKYAKTQVMICLLYTSPSPRDRYISRMPSSA